MWVHDGVRVLLLNDDGEVEGETLIPNTIWSEINGVSLVVEENEWWVLLVRHAVDVNLWFIVTFWIGQLWKFVLVDITYGELPGGLNIGNEIWVVVVEDLNIKIELDKLIESRATSQDGSGLTDSIFTGGVDVDGTTSIVSCPSSEVWTSFGTVLEEPGLTLVHLGDDTGSSTFLTDGIWLLVLTSVVLNTVGHVDTLLSTHSWILESINQIEST